MVPLGLCIYCGHERPPTRPALACQHCGNTAENVRWWPKIKGGRDPSGVTLGVLLVIVLAGLVVCFALRATSEPWSSYAIVAIVAALIASPVVKKLFRRTSHVWAFASLDGERIGTAIWNAGKLFTAFGVRTSGAPIAVPDYAKEITAAAARAAGVRALGPGVCLALKIDEATYGEDFSEQSLAPMIAAALVGMAAREGCSLHWQHGWRFSQFSSPNLGPHQQMAFTSGAAPTEDGDFERRILELIAKAEADNARAWRVPSAEEQTDAHYRAQAAASTTRFCTLDDLARVLYESPDLRDVSHIVADPSHASEASLAFRAFAASHPDVVAHLVDTFGDC